MSDIKIPVFNEEFDLGLFLFIAKRKIIWLFAFLAVSLAISYTYLHFKRPLYQANSVVLINKTNEASRVLNVQSFNELDNVAEEVELLRSEVFRQSVLKNLGLEVEYFTKGDVLVADQYMNSPIRVTTKNILNEARDVPVYVYPTDEPSTLVLLHGTLTGDIRDTIRVGAESVTSLGSMIVSITDLQGFRNMQENNTLFFIMHNPDKLAELYAHEITIAPENEAANTVSILVKDYNRTKAATIANAMARKFTEYNLEKTAQSATNVLRFIEEQMDTVYTRLQSTEKILRSFKNENKIRDVEDLSIKYMDRLNSLEEEKMKADLEVSMITELEKAIKDSINTKNVYNVIPLIAGASFGPTVTQMVDRLHKLLLDREEALYSVKPNNEGIRSIEYQIDVQKNLLIQTILSIRQRLNIKTESIGGKIKEIESVFYNTPSKEIKLEQLQRQFNTDEKFYTLLLEKKAEYQISRAGYVSNYTILAEASIPSSPISPNRPLIIMGSILASLALGIAIIIFSYLTYNEITSVAEVAKYTKAALLGVIPKHSEKIPVSQLLVDKKPKSLISEAFRTARTNLQFISNEPGPKSIAVTSTISGEGKTFITINLGGILAYAGKKVIILDLDLRKPKIHLGFNTVNDKGMSTLLIGKDEIGNCIRHSSLENLDFITAGPIPPNPSELIISPRLDDIIVQLKQSYDVILIDNPPVGIVTDGLTNIQKADYPIYILKANFSKRNFLQNVNKLIDENNIRKLSVILNGVNTRQHGYGYGYGYGNNYGYGYGYGSGYYDEDKDGRKRKRSFIKRLFGKHKRP